MKEKQGVGFRLEADICSSALADVGAATTNCTGKFRPLFASENLHPNTLWRYFWRKYAKRRAMRQKFDKTLIIIIKFNRTLDVFKKKRWTSRPILSILLLGKRARKQCCNGYSLI